MPAAPEAGPAEEEDEMRKYLPDVKPAVADQQEQDVEQLTIDFGVYALLLTDVPMHVFRFSLIELQDFLYQSSPGLGILEKVAWSKDLAANLESTITMTSSFKAASNLVD